MKDNDIKRIISDLTKHYSNTKTPINFPHANTFDDLMYRAGLTAQGCWDSMDQYDREAIVKFAQLIVKECITTLETAENVYQDYRNQIEDGMRDHCIRLIKNKFGVEE